VRRNELVAFLVALALIAVPRLAAATTCYCMPDTLHPDMAFETDAAQCDQVTWEDACVCHDACGTTAAGGGQINPAVTKAVGSVFLVVLFFIVPGRVLRWLGGDPARDAFEAKWRAVKDEIAGYETRGREVEALRDGLLAAEASGRAEDELLRDGPNDAKKKPPVPNRLWRKSLEAGDFGCTGARRRLRLGAKAWPIADFPDWDAFLKRCPAEKGVAPVPAEQCTADDLRCVSYPEVGCPRSHPNYNDCDQKCYRLPSYDASRDFAVAACEKTESCKLPSTTP
jgi:hypothetical protein